MTVHCRKTRRTINSRTVLRASVRKGGRGAGEERVARSLAPTLREVRPLQPFPLPRPPSRIADPHQPPVAPRRAARAALQPCLTTCYAGRDSRRTSALFFFAKHASARHRATPSTLSSTVSRRGIRQRAPPRPNPRPSRGRAPVRLREEPHSLPRVLEGRNARFVTPYTKRTIKVMLKAVEWKRLSAIVVGGNGQSFICLAT